MFNMKSKAFSDSSTTKSTTWVSAVESSTAAAGESDALVRPRKAGMSLSRAATNSTSADIRVQAR